MVAVGKLARKLLRGSKKQTREFAIPAERSSAPRETEQTRDRVLPKTRARAPRLQRVVGLEVTGSTPEHNPRNVVVRRPARTGQGGVRPATGKLDENKGSRLESLKSQGEAEKHTNVLRRPHRTHASSKPGGSAACGDPGGWTVPERSWQSTPRWFLRCIATVLLISKRRMKMVRCCRLLVSGKREHTQSSWDDAAGLGWSSWPVRLGNVGRSRSGRFLFLLAKAKARSEPPILRKRVEQAWRMRWRSILSCAAARAFAASLLELKHGRGADGDVMAWSTSLVTPGCRDGVWISVTAQIRLPYC